MPPTVIADVDSKARIFQEEIFGPVLAVTKARDFDHAMELANDSRIRTHRRDVLERSRNISAQRASEFFVGNLYVNRKCTGAMVGAHPFGGFNMSGTDSKGGGPDYLLLFLQLKSIAERVGSVGRHPVCGGLVGRPARRRAPYRVGPACQNLHLGFWYAITLSMNAIMVSTF